MFDHLNQFNTIFTHLFTQGIKFDDSIKAMFLLVTLAKSWDTFRTGISNYAPKDGLSSTDVEGSLLIEEVNCKNQDFSKGGNALVVCGRSAKKGKKNDRNKSHSKSRARKDIDCYHCHKKGHMKKDCRTWKQEKGK